MTVDALKDCNKKHLSQMAKERGIAGWHAMRKDQLIRALSAVRSATPPKSRKERPAPRSPKNVKRPASVPAPAPESPIRPMAVPHALDHASQKDRIIVLARDSYWLHAHWELSRATLARAKAALGQEWHSAQPILRVLDVTSEDTTNAAERHVRDVPIHGGVSNWYIDVVDPPRSYRVDVGYLSRRGKFYVLARSNIVTTPKAGVTDALEENWANVQQQFDRVQNPSTINAKGTPASVDLNDLFDERLRRPLSSQSMRDLSLGALPGLGRRFHFEIDAELIVYGSTEPDAQVTLQGEQVQLRPDGTFTVRFRLPDSRQIIPAVASSGDGVEERTIVLAVERNTKELEPMIHDSNEL